ncbi:MAG: aminotransferase class [bacterium]|nr:aminotransferase class [bacterium]
MSSNKGPDLYRRAKQRIPGGTQLLSKRPEMFLPENWPSYYARARGVEVTDLDERTFVDFSIMAIGSCILGYADPDVDGAVKQAVDAGVACTLNAPEEVELADLLCELHPWAQMVRYARSGGEAMSVAVRIARAHTRRDLVAFSGYHGWTDWYLAANIGESSALDGHLLPGLDPAGVPRELRGSALPFHYNRLDELKQIVAAHRGELAAIVMEPRRDEPPAPGFLEAVRQIADDVGAVLVFDEVTTGFRECVGGIHLTMGVNPDIAVFAKSMANGYAMSAIVGKAAVMEAAQSTFISSTNWTERIGPTAALATINKIRRVGVVAHNQAIGARTIAGWKQLAEAHGFHLHASNLATLAHFKIEHADDLALTTLFTQEMLARGYLAWTNFKPSFAHTADHVDQYLRAVDDVFKMMREATDRGDVRERLKGPAQRRGFYRLTS